MRHDTSGILQGNTTNYSFIIATVIKICANDNAARATRNNSATVNLKYGMHSLHPSLPFGKSRFACNLAAITPLNHFRNIFYILSISG